MRLIQKHQQANGKGQGKLQYADIKDSPYVWNPKEPEDTTMENFPLVLDYDTVKKAKDDYKKAKDFVQEYTSGEHYSKNFPVVVTFKDESLPIMFVERGDKPFPELVYSGDGSYYNVDSNTIGYDPAQQVKGFEDPVAVMVHELGHYLDKNYKETYTKKYPNIGLSSSTSSRFWFDESKSFQNFKDFLKSANVDTTYFMENPERYYEMEHDGLPSESYADLLATRYLLKNQRVYDSNSAIDWETEQRILDFMKKYPQFRLFQNFGEFEVPMMLKYISKNKTPKNNQTKLSLT